MSYDMIMSPRDGDADPENIGNITSNVRTQLKLMLGEEVWQDLTGPRGCAAWFYVYACRDAIGWWSNLSSLRKDAIAFATNPDNGWGDMNATVSFLQSTSSYLSLGDRADGQIVRIYA